MIGADRLRRLAARQARIREQFAARPGVSVSMLAREFDVSEMTIRRDLAALEAGSHLQRTHGGAVLSERMILEFDYRERRERNRAAKRAIAAEARKLVQPGQRLILDTGTTTLEPVAESGGARLKLRATVEVRIPLVGGKLENFIGSQLIELLIREQRFTTTWIGESA